MTQWNGQTGLLSLQDDLLSATKIALEAGPGGKLSRACIVPGDIAWDGCDCGLLAISNFRWFLSATFPARGRSLDTPAGPCPPHLIVGELLITAMRCAPMPKEDGTAPDCRELDAAARLVTREAHIVMSTVMCRLEELKDDFIGDYLMGEQVAMGPAGGCVGSTLMVSVSLDWSK